MPLHDVSLPIGPDLLTWPGDPPVTIEPAKRIARGDAANVSELRIGTHTGTHVDPPAHFLDGRAGVDRVPVDVLFGPAFVVDARDLRGQLGPKDLDGLGVPEGTERLLIKSANSEIWRRLPAEFPDEFVCLSPDGAGWIVERGIRLVGVDFLSVEQFDAPHEHPVHVELLSNDVVIVEGLNLGDVEPGPYTLVCLPLKIVDGDGAPARAVLFRPD